MCEFFSFVTKGSKKYYFNWEQRKQLLKSNPDHLRPDSHASICDFYKVDEDKVNKYEYNPLTKVFEVDQINIKDNRGLAKKWVTKLDFAKIVEPLNIQEIFNPLSIKTTVTEEHIALLQKWASVRASVGDSVRDSVWASVGDSVRDSVWASVWDSVRASVRDSVRASVRDSVRDSVWASVGASVWDSVGDSVWASVRASVWDSVGDSVWASVRASVGDSVWAYTSLFFRLNNWHYIEHKPGENPYGCLIQLWESGLVPSFDGEIWRLHSGEKADIVFEIKKDELESK